MKTKFFAKFFIIFSLICNTFAFSLPTFAASFNMTSSVKQVAPGGTFSVSVGGDCIGRVNIKVVGGTAHPKRRLGGRKLPDRHYYSRE